MANEKRFTVKDLISFLQDLPPETKILINGEITHYDLLEQDALYKRMYLLWHSDYNGNGTPYESWAYEPSDFVYPREPYMEIPRPDYITKTIGEEFVVILG